MEHRWGKRVIVHIPVQLTVAEPFFSCDGQVTDLSVSGARIVTSQPLRILSRIQVLIDASILPKGPAATLTAYVARHHTSGVAVEWCQFAPAAVADILRGLNRNQAIGVDRGERL